MRLSFEPSTRRKRACRVQYSSGGGALALSSIYASPHLHPRHGTAGSAAFPACARNPNRVNRLIAAAGRRKVQQGMQFLPISLLPWASL